MSSSSAAEVELQPLEISADEQQEDGIKAIIPGVTLLANHLHFAYGDYVGPLMEACALLNIDPLPL